VDAGGSADREECKYRGNKYLKYLFNQWVTSNSKDKACDCSRLKDFHESESKIPRELLGALSRETSFLAMPLKTCGDMSSGPFFRPTMGKE
jgi:hypothetical protein